MTHNKNLNPLSHLLINCILFKISTPNIVYKADYTLYFLNFPVIDLCSYSDNSVFDIFSFLTVNLFAPPENFLSKNL